MNICFVTTNYKDCLLLLEKSELLGNPEVICISPNFERIEHPPPPNLSFFVHPFNVAARLNLAIDLAVSPTICIVSGLREVDDRFIEVFESMRLLANEDRIVGINGLTLSHRISESISFGDSDYVTGNLMIFDRLHINRLRIRFNERYDNHYWDADFCLHAKKNGMKVLSLPDRDRPDDVLEAYPWRHSALDRSDRKLFLSNWRRYIRTRKDEYVRDFSVAAVYVVHYGDDFLPYSVESIIDHVEKVILCVGIRSWSYKDETVITASMLNTLRELERKYDKVQVVYVDKFEKDEDQRNTTIELVKDFDYYFLLDCDEVYDPLALDRLYQYVSERPDVSVFRLPFVHFWRSFSYRLEETVYKPVERLFKLGRRFYFKWSSKSGYKEKTKVNVPEEVIRCFHFSYSRAAECIEQKTRIWAHATDVRPNWFHDVFQAWPNDREMIDIHPYMGEQELWKRATFFDKEQLPTLMRKHPYYDMDIIP